MVAEMGGWGERESSLCFGACGFTPSALPGISPTRREISKMRYPRFVLKRRDWRDPATS
ncbi:hypothetical protein At1D1108_19430 [Agrobacterium tumefaciens]|nr:hypothetical protein At1D1108_19430 [Agrobacterium tumefaciens]